MRYCQEEYVQKGAGYGLQTGRGVGDFLGKMYHKAAPHIKSAIPHIKSVSKKVAASPVARDIFKTAKKNAIEAGLQLAVDSLQGKGVKKNLGEKVGKAKREIVETIQKSLSPKEHVAQRRGKKRGRIDTAVKKTTRKRRRVRDIFD